MAWFCRYEPYTSNCLSLRVRSVTSTPIAASAALIDVTVWLGEQMPQMRLEM